MVPLQTAASGVLPVPIGQFLSLMLGVHLVIGLFEGAITFAVLAFLRRVRPELLGLETAPIGSSTRPGLTAVAASILATALLLAGVASWFASTCPDGLEWACSEVQIEAAEPVANEEPASWPNVDGRQSLAAVFGTLVTLGLVFGFAKGVPKQKLRNES
jgi:hypothetical protein